jgi:predicted glycosyltransferase
MLQRSSGTGPRALFYSHDTVGLGHIRRTLRICEHLDFNFPNLSMLLVTGSPVAHAFRAPAGLDYVKLPSVIKRGDDCYETRTLRVPFQMTRRLRARLLLDTVSAYRPDFLFVDNVPLGMKGELTTTLEHISRHLPDTLVFLTLRDILDDASRVVPQWRRLGIIEALERYYTRVFIYGLRTVFDPTVEYQWPATVRRKTVFCGYIARSVDKTVSRALRRQICAADERLVVVTIGGGSDGSDIVDTYLRALPLITRQIAVKSLVILGPEMAPHEASRLRRVCERRGVIVMDFCADPMPYLDAADLVVSMAGYNTITEILTLDKKAIVIPRTQPRREQLIRSQRLQEFGLLRAIEPAELTRDRLAAEVHHSLQTTDVPIPTRLEFTGLERLTLEMHALLAEESSRLLNRVEARVV